MREKIKDFFILTIGNSNSETVKKKKIIKSKENINDCELRRMRTNNGGVKTHSAVNLEKQNKYY